MVASDAKIHVLLVDDQALIRTALAEQLGASAGIEIVATAGTLAEAILCAEEFQPNIVLMDVLPEPDIFDGAKTILDRCPNTVLILLDEAPFDTHVREALRIGAAGYLTKHQSFCQIDAALRQAVLGERVFAPEIARRLVMLDQGVRLEAQNKQHLLAGLTPKEIQVLIHLAQGSSVKECAKVLGISPNTVGNHKSRLMKKLNVHKAVELVHLAICEGIVANKLSAIRQTMDGPGEMS